MTYRKFLIRFLLRAYQCLLPAKFNFLFEIARNSKSANRIFYSYFMAITFYFLYFLEHIQHTDGPTLSNNTGITSVSCHSGYVSADAVLWNFSGSFSIVYYVDAGVE